MSIWSAPWDLRQRGTKDAARHDARVKDAVRKRLKEIISEESIITSDGTKRVRIPMRYLEQYRFIYGNPQQGGVGQGDGNVGDELWRPGQSGNQDGEAGDQPGEHGYEEEIDLASVTQMMLEDLGLPWLEEKPHTRNIVEDAFEFTDLRKKGAWANFDKRRSLRNNLMRNARKREPGIHDLREDDLRFRVWDIRHKEITQAAMYLMLDWSGSMTAEKKFLAKAISFWVVQFLRLKYQHVDIVFIAHDIEAEIVSEKDFFGRSEGGGTVCSSAYKVALCHIDQHHPKALWNIFALHFSDGDNMTSDNATCLICMRNLLTHCQAVGYAEILHAQASAASTTGLMATYKAIEHPHFIRAVVKTKDDIRATLQAFFGQEILHAAT